MLELIPAIDSFEMAFAHKESWEQAPENWRTGVEYIYQQLIKILQNHGIAQTNPVGEAFNPGEHTALETVDTSEKEEDQKIVTVIQRGYKMNDKIIRPAQVKIANYKV